MSSSIYHNKKYRTNHILQEIAMKGDPEKFSNEYGSHQESGHEMHDILRAPDESKWGQ